ncbi:uncharacterized protein GGS25DRAFT_483105 [Hypoxylon fragiforme]|uniref:uncharacterized protein n=1 Tax=Hypoxylon fragiforme TaxID=63214 RepID=UPI0020C5B488|nr:uncharacterized protein GGS25DRAFT_483105 [Hypoxylon fragiforme]KAI2611531.1 hypothetical protein GGS25DRAFT_483105 [Hypoxylon fragiforme]
MGWDGMGWASWDGMQLLLVRMSSASLMLHRSTHGQIPNRSVGDRTNPWATSGIQKKQLTGPELLVPCRNRHHRTTTHQCLIHYHLIIQCSPIPPFLFFPNVGKE